MIRNFSLLLAIVISALSLKTYALEDENKFGQALFSTPEFLKVDEAYQFSSEIVAGGLQLNWEIAEAYYLYRGRFKFKTEQPNVIIGDPQFSTEGKAKQDPYFGEIHAIYDELSVFLPVSLAKGQSDAEIKITYQGCAEAGLCYPPKHQYVLYTAEGQGSSSKPENRANSAITSELSQAQDLENASGISSFIQNSSLALIIGIFFLLGLGLTFTPCVFPMIPIITSIIAGQKHPTTGKSLVLSSSYVLGMASTYSAAGVITGLLGAGANIQAALQNPVLLSVFAIIFVLLALSMFGLYELQLPAFIRDRLNNTSQKLHGGHITSVFLIGALSALIVSPCVSAPLAGALLYISSTADAVVGGLSLFAMGLGMGVPLIIISVGGGKFFPKAGHWMDAIKAIFGVMMIAVAIWLISRVIPDEISLLLWALLLGLSATQMGAFDPARAGWPRLAKGLGLFLALYAALLTVGAFSGAKDPFNPLEMIISPSASNEVTAAPSSKLAFKVIQDQQGLEAQRKIAMQLGKPMIVDFYADWCISCKVMENQVFPKPEIRSKLNQFHLVKADVTDNTSANEALLNQFGLFGPPAILLFDAQGKEMTKLRVVGEINRTNFDSRLTQALQTTQALQI